MSQASISWRRRFQLALACSFILGLLTPFAFAQETEDEDLSKRPDAEVAKILQALQRDPGQTEFLSADVSTPMFFARSRGGMALESAAMAPNGGAGERREIEESDVYRFSEDGKTLYYLSNYRGFLVIDVSKGVDQAKIVDRVAPTGNTPFEMYVDEKNKRALVLEKYNWGDDDDQDKSNDSRFISIDFSGDKAKITKKQGLNGRLSDSRKVGKVIYVAAAEPWNYYSRGDDEAFKGSLTAYSLDEKGEIAQVGDAFTLSAQLVSNKSLGIVESYDEKTGYSYHAVAVLSDDVFGWSRRQAMVEVVDISDPNGAIKPVMKVSVKGATEKRWMSIRDGNLIVASNYFLDDKGNETPNRWGSTGRNALEVFKLPAGSDRVFSEDEIRHALLGIKLKVDAAIKERNLDADEINKLEAKLIAESPLPLRAAFYRPAQENENFALRRRDTAPKTLVKALPNYVDTRGSTDGQSASLRTVDFGPDYVTISWVPTNEVDPRDNYSLENPAEPAYQGRLLYEGWIERSFSMRYQGRDFVVGLGIITPSESEARTRRVQVKIFEVVKIPVTDPKEDEPKFKLEERDIATAIMPEKVWWTNFQDEDKMYNFRFDPETGLTSITYPVSGQTNGSYYTGAKPVEFDLTKVDSDKDSVISTDTNLVVARSGYPKRVAPGPEGEATVIFSDENISVFDPRQDRIVEIAGKPVNPGINLTQSELEVARNIVATGLFSNGKSPAELGFQIVGKRRIDAEGGQVSYSSELQDTQIRFVDASKLDSEFHELKAAMEVPGAYFGHQVISENTVLFATFRQEQLGKVETVDGNQEQIKVTFTIYEAAVAPKKGVSFENKAILQQEMVMTRDEFWALQYPGFRGQQENVDPATNFTRSLGNLSRLTKTKFLVDAPFGLSVLTVPANREKTTLAPVVLSSDALESLKEAGVTSQPEIIELGGRPYLYIQTKIGNIPLLNGSPLEVTKYHLAVISNPTALSWSIGPLVNVPGKPLAIKKSGKTSRIVFDDKTLEDLLDPSENPDPVKDEGDTKKARRLQVSSYGTPSALVRSTITQVSIDGEGNPVLEDYEYMSPSEKLEFKVAGTSLVRVVSTEEESNHPRPFFGGGRRIGIMPHWGGESSAGENIPSHLELVHMEKDSGTYIEKVLIPGLELKGSVSLRGISQDPENKNAYYALISAGQKSQVLRWETTASEATVAEVIKVYPLDEQGTAAEEAVATFKTPRSSFYFYSMFGGLQDSDKVVIDPASSTVAIASGMQGVCQAKLKGQ